LVAPRDRALRRMSMTAGVSMFSRRISSVIEQ
jgi:hypothetical protein